LARPGNHLARLRPAVREVLVAEYRHALARLPEDLDDLLHHLEAGIEDLSLVVAWIVAMFADEQDALNRELVAAERECLGDAARVANPMLAGQLLREIVLRELIDPKRGDLLAWDVEAAFLRIAVEEAAGDMISVRHRPVDGTQGRDGFAVTLRRFGRP